MVCSFCFNNSLHKKENIFLGFIEDELNSLLGATIYQFIFDSTSKDIR